MQLALLLLELTQMCLSLDANDAIPCHMTDGPMDKRLKCDSSPQQIVSSVHAKIKQKKNLIIIEIKDAILQPEWKFHGFSPPSVYHQSAQDLPFHLYLDDISGVELLFLYQPEPLVIVFRKHLFETLEYIFSNSTADLVIYTRQNSEYAEQVSRAIEERFKQKYGIISEGLLYIYAL